MGINPLRQFWFFAVEGRVDVGRGFLVMEVVILLVWEASTSAPAADSPKPSMDASNAFAALLLV
jgi:hypothetical protein